jgi:hypothetical protein
VSECLAAASVSIAERAGVTCAIIEAEQSQRSGGNGGLAFGGAGRSASLSTSENEARPCSAWRATWPVLAATRKLFCWSTPGRSISCLL